jgi:hypothetical protein
MVSSAVQFVRKTVAHARRAFVRNRLIFLAVTAILLATVPGDLQDHSHWRNVAWVPLLTGLVRPADMLANLVLYFPLGATLHWGRPNQRLWSTVTVAVVFAVGIELTQVWSHSRFPSATDAAMNVAGAVLGATWARRRVERRASSDGTGAQEV